MATGLIALLDDVVALAKVAAASLDDTAAAAGRAGVKAAGVVIDDAAVTPRYVTGFSAARELPIVWRITLGSLRNKLLYLLPAALALSAFAPWAITPLLMAGGAYLCFEGAEKLYEKLAPHGPPHADKPAPADPAAFEAATIGGAIRTDLILSGEIMAITLASVADAGFWERAVVLAVVGIGITVVVYGAVALIVKADDAGVALARLPGAGAAPLRAVGRGLVVGMPWFLKGLAAIGTAAMLWVGGGIIVHALDGYGVGAPAAVIHDVATAAGTVAGGLRPAVEWLVGAIGSGVVGIAVGGAIVAGLHLLPKR